MYEVIYYNRPKGSKKKSQPAWWAYAGDVRRKKEKGKKKKH